VIELITKEVLQRAKEIYVEMFGLSKEYLKEGYAWNAEYALGVVLLAKELDTAK
jgi:hypothetical protein